MFKKILKKMNYTLPSGRTDWEEVRFDIITLVFLILIVGGAFYANN